MKKLELLLEHFFAVRDFTQKLCEPLEIEDYVVQPVAETSPPKWHLAHTSWFFEHFILKPHLSQYKVFNSLYSNLFNSYYNCAGDRTVRSQRGALSRPTVAEIFDYRHYVTEKIGNLFINQAQEDNLEELLQLLELGIHHEQQHQELLIMDIKYLLGQNSVRAPYLETAKNFSNILPPNDFIAVDGGVAEVGHHKPGGFAYCNEMPKHKVYIDNFKIQQRPISNKEFLNFIEDGGYENHLLWKSDGWDYIQQSCDRKPLYWFKDSEGQWMEYTLYGAIPLRPYTPVTHINLFEADAFACWAGDRLPREEEWELAATLVAESDLGFFNWKELEASYFPHGESTFFSLRGNGWEWTSSPYLPYPGYQRPKDFLREYNYKFMNGQYVLRGGSYATMRDHYRDTYRNYFYPHQKWAITTLRLARND